MRRVPALPEGTVPALNFLVIYVALPALLPWAMLVVSALAILAAARLLAWDRPTTGALLLVPLGNTSFMGIPLVNAFFGEVGIPYAVIYDQIGSFLALATYGSLVVAVYGGQGERPTWRTVAKKIATFPPFLALLPTDYAAASNSCAESICASTSWIAA